MKGFRVYLAVLFGLAVWTAGAAGSQPLWPGLGDAVGRDPERTFTVWVFFQDKELTPEGEREALRALGAAWPERSLERRAKVRAGALLDRRDLPVGAEGVRQLIRRGARVRARSRWLNAVSVEIPGRCVPAIAELPGVREVRPVARYLRPRLERAKGRPEAAADALYGPGLNQVAQIQVPDLHDIGLSGQGVRIALLDTGFGRGHESLRHVKTFAEWDFVNQDGVTAYEPGDPVGQADHGTMTLSVIGAYRPGRLIGPAYGADYVLAKTEMDDQEVPVEEDYWVMAVEWAESLGVDIVSSSLGYLDWYSQEDMDGNTAVTTRAADMAAANGVLVVNSAGNEANNAWGTVIAPADGDSVLAVGAVSPSPLDSWVSFSSEGPTADGRIKPDVMAQGLWDYAASPSDSGGYEYVQGTSFSAPLVAGLAALLLEAHPDWTPWDLIVTLRSTATRADHPDNRYGWGICQGMAALLWTPTPSPAVLASSAPSALVCPNPFHAGDAIRLLGGAEDRLAPSIGVYDCLGRLVFTLKPEADPYEYRWDAVDLEGRPLAPGVYFLRWPGTPQGRAHKVVLVR